MSGKTAFLSGVLIFFAAVSPATAFADNDDTTTKPPHMVPVTKEKITIDGVVDETAWGAALQLELKYEVRPRENVTPDVRTEMFVTYDAANVYVAFKCHDPEAALIRARFVDRDRIWSDDFVGVVLDTFNDQRHAYEFFCNPFGVQGDMAMDDVIGNEDSSWNAIWESAGRVTAEGYEVEMAIPFSQLSFQATDGPQTWGIDAIRSWKRGNSVHIGLFPRVRGNNSYLAQTVKISGFEDIQPGKNLEITPTVTSSRTEVRNDFPYGELEETESKSDLGVTVRWGITPNITLNGTINPDFSQIEADVVQLDINRQFAISYNETRPFFLDGATYFNTPRIDLVYTRNIIDPNGAAKITGKEGDHTFGLFVAQDDVTSIILPGAQGSRGALFNMKTTDAVGRYRFDFGGSSTVGAMFTDREGNGYHNRVMALDGNYRFTKNDYLQFTAAGSSTRYNAEMGARFGVGLEEQTGHGFNGIIAHRDRNWFYQAAYLDFSDEFRADLGYVPQVGYRKAIAGGGREFWGEDGDFFTRITLSGDYDQTETQDGHVLERELEGIVQGTFVKESYFNFGGGHRTMVYNNVSFDQDFYYWYVESTPMSWLYVNCEGSGGDWVDFAHTRPATQFYISPGLEFRGDKHLTVRLNHVFSTLDVAGGRLFTTLIPEARITWQQDERLRLRAIFQYVQIDRNQDLYAFDVERTTKDLLTQLLFSYKLNAQTVLYLGYSDNYVGNENFGMTQLSRTFFAKVGYAWLE